MFQKRINKRNYFPNVLIKNNKNYRFSNRNLQKNENKEECLNITNCSKCVITKKKIEENKINGIYYERIYGGLDFQKKNNYENEKYKCKKNIHLGVQTPKELINLNNENSIRNINPYIEKIINIKNLILIVIVLMKLKMNTTQNILIILII